MAGLGLGLGLIVAIGAQNAHVLRYGLRRERVGLVVAICAVSDLVLIAVGTAGVGTVIAASRTLTVVMTLLGAVVLVAYGAAAARRAVRGDGALVVEGEAGGVAAVTAVAATTLALTWLNPHVYLDTVFFLGLVASGHGEARWVFAAGAMLGSILWFFGLAFGARYLSRWLATPRAWRILDALIAVVMIALAVSLVLVP